MSLNCFTKLSGEPANRGEVSSPRLTMMRRAPPRDAGEIVTFTRAPFSPSQVAVCGVCLPAHPCPLHDPHSRVLSRAHHTRHALRRAEKRRRRLRFAHDRPAAHKLRPVLPKGASRRAPKRGRRCGCVRRVGTVQRPTSPTVDRIADFELREHAFPRDGRRPRRVGPPFSFYSMEGIRWGRDAEKTSRKVKQEGRGGRTGAKLATAAAHQPTDTSAGLCPSPAPVIETV